MTRTQLVILGLALGWLASGCSQTPQLQGAEITTPRIASPLVPTEIPSTVSSPAAAEPSGVVPAEDGSQGVSFVLESSAFQPGEAIPMRFSCDGEDISPDLAWGPPPEGTASLALIMDDPDAPGGTWVHWVIFNIPPATTGLPEAVPTDGELNDGSRQGLNSGGRLGYAGPCPPGETHRYFFKLFALDHALDLPAGIAENELSAAMEGYILGRAEMMGTYTRD